MLSIDRKIEQSIYIGSSELKVLEIKERSVMFSFAGKQYRIPSGHSLQLERTEVFLFSVFGDKARLGLDAPREVTILRGELYNKGKQPFDNSTKQFPSGNF